METPTHLAVEAELFQSIGLYLGRQPYVEVADLIDGLKHCHVVTLADAPAEPDPPPGNGQTGPIDLAEGLADVVTDAPISEPPAAVT